MAEKRVRNEDLGKQGNKRSGSKRSGDRIKKSAPKSKTSSTNGKHRDSLSKDRRTKGNSRKTGTSSSSKPVKTSGASSKKGSNTKTSNTKTSGTSSKKGSNTKGSNSSNKLRKLEYDYEEGYNYSETYEDDYDYLENDDLSTEDYTAMMLSKKKPFYKNMWIVAVIVLIAIPVLYNIGTSDDDEKTTFSETVSSKVDTSMEDEKEDSEGEKGKFYAIGESGEVSEVSYTLNSVELTDDRGILDDGEDKNVIKVSYTVENKSDSDVSVGIADVEAYDSEDKKLDSYVAGDTTMDTVAKGKKIDAVIYFTTDKLGEIELQFSPVLGFGGTVNFKASI